MGTHLAVYSSAPGFFRQPLLGGLVQVLFQIRKFFFKILLNAHRTKQLKPPNHFLLFLMSSHVDREVAHAPLCTRGGKPSGPST